MMNDKKPEPRDQFADWLGQTLNRGRPVAPAEPEPAVPRAPRVDMSQGRGLTVREQDPSVVFEEMLRSLIHPGAGDGGWREIR
jgi:hypothetical protein